MKEVAKHISQVLHLTQTVGRRSYGVGQVALHLAREQGKLGAAAQIWTFDGAEDIRWALEDVDLPAGVIRGFIPSPPRFLGFSRAMEKAARSAEWPSRLVVHQHLIWLMLSRMPGLIRRTGSVRVVVAPHGTLDDWALRKSHWKKTLAAWIYERQNLRTADCLHATSEREIANFRNYGLSNPIALINNGVSEACLDSRGNGPAFRDAHRIASGRPIMLFISRIARKKGLPMLLDAMQRLRHRLKDWLLVVAGVDEEGHETELRSKVQQLRLTGQVVFTGPLFGQSKRDALEAAEVFVLPSHSEGAPMIVLEAMAAGVPVLTTKSAPWEELVRRSCGWWSDISVEGLCEALEDVASMSRQRRKDMGARAKALVAEHYSWRESARKTLELYAWLHGVGVKPPFVLAGSK